MGREIGNNHFWNIKTLVFKKNRGYKNMIKKVKIIKEKPYISTIQGF